MGCGTASSYQIQTDFVAELNGTGVAAVFAANTDHQIRPRLMAFFHRNPHQTGPRPAVEHGKGVVLQDMLVNIGQEELASASSRLNLKHVCVRSLVQS